MRVAQRALGLGRELERERHAKGLVHGRNHIKDVGHLLLDLIDGAEDVRVVLLEAAHAGQARERAAELVAVEHAKVGHAEGQVSVAAGAGGEEEAVARAVHRLEAKLLFSSSLSFVRF